MEDDGARDGSLGDSNSTDEAGFFDLRPPIPSTGNNVGTEDVMARLMSAEHLHFILGDHVLFCRFSSFLNKYHYQLVPTLIRYLDMRKAMKAIDYANSVVKNINWPSNTDFCKFTRIPLTSADVRFEEYAARELSLLCAEALGPFITHNMIAVVAYCLGKEITGQGIPIVQSLVGNLAEVFCLTDPSVHDNPIIFASEEFHKTTQYGTTYAINRNCRFLQGPATDKNTTSRITKAVSLGQESHELILNYRRDGTPFINLLMCAPLYDDKGNIRYYIGAQVDVTGLVKEGVGIESFRNLLQKEKDSQIECERGSESARLANSITSKLTTDSLTILQELSTMFRQEESDIVNRNSRVSDDSTDASSVRSSVPTSVVDRSQRKRIIGTDEIQDGQVLGVNLLNHNRKHPAATSSLPGVYKHYLLVRPYPSLQIIFVSPSLRIPGLLRTHLFTKLGGPSATIAALESAFRDGASVTAKVLWLPKRTCPGERGRGPAGVKSRYIRCTPLLGSDDRVGVWIVVLVAADGHNAELGIDRSDDFGDMAMDDLIIDDKQRHGTVPRSRSKAAGIRKSESVDGDSDGVFELRKVRGRMGDERELYAEYLKSTMPQGPRGLRSRTPSMSTDRRKMFFE